MLPIRLRQYLFDLSWPRPFGRCAVVHQEPTWVMTFRIGKYQAPALPSCTAQRDGEFPALEPCKASVKNCIFVLIYYIHDGTEQKGGKTEEKRKQPKTNDTKIEKKDCTGLGAFVGTPGDTGAVDGGLEGCGVCLG